MQSPEFRLGELVRRELEAAHDPREVVADANARYFGALLSERTLVPGVDARLGDTTFEAWLSQRAGAASRALPETALRGAGRRP